LRLVTPSRLNALITVIAQARVCRSLLDHPVQSEQMLVRLRSPGAELDTLCRVFTLATRPAATRAGMARLASGRGRI
jgi:hypothetical protein